MSLPTCLKIFTAAFCDADITDNVLLFYFTVLCYCLGFFAIDDVAEIVLLYVTFLFYCLGFFSMMSLPTCLKMLYFFSMILCSVTV